jgi:hypothetical protein
MCISLATAAVIASLAGTGVAVAGAIQQGKTQGEIAQFNADTAKFQADDAAKAGLVAEENQLAKTKQIRAQQEVIMGAGGLDPTTGTATQVLDQTTKMGTLDALTLRTNAARQAWGYSTQATNSELQGASARTAGYFGAAGTLLSGGARAYGLYNKKG